MRLAPGQRPGAQSCASQDRRTTVNANAFDATGIRDLSTQVLEPDLPGRVRVLPAEFWASTTPAERALVAARHGLYGLPTVELVTWLREFIGGRRAIEIGAGNGALAHALGIPATDSCLQTDPAIAAYYAALGQALVTYGPNVEKLDAHAALRKHRPQVVIGCWVTHKYDPARHGAGGNEFGIVEEAIVDACEHYVLIGNERVHKDKSVWRRPHQKFEPPWLYSRSVNGSKDFIAVFPGGRRFCGTSAGGPPEL